MLVFVTKGAALAVLRPRRVLRNDIERQLGNGCQPLAGILFHVPDWVLLFEGLDLLYQRLKLCKEQWGDEDHPP